MPKGVLRELTKEDGDWVKDNLKYDPETGHLWWIKQISGKGGRRDLNRPAGHNSHGYLLVHIDICGSIRTTIKLHRVAWYLTYGVWPKNQIDHINGIRNDNRIINLRMATHSENMYNQRPQINGTSKYKGVCWSKSGCKWRAYIMVDRKQIYLGYHDNEKEAALAYNKAAIEHFGEYAKINDVAP